MMRVVLVPVHTAVLQRQNWLTAEKLRPPYVIMTFLVVTVVLFLQFDLFLQRSAKTLLDDLMLEVNWFWFQIAIKR